MRFAVTGDDRVALSVARAAVSHSAHLLVRRVETPGTRDAPPLIAPGLSYCRSWEDLLADAEVDAVIVGDDGDEGRQAIRQLAQAGKIVLFGPGLTEPMEFFYELALLEGESPGRLFPLLPLRAHPTVAELKRALDRQAFGRLRHVRLERQIAVKTQAGGASFLSAPVIERALVSDADLLRTLCGSYDQVTASRSGDPAEGYSLATVTLGGASAPQAVWSAAASQTADEWKLTLTGESGNAVLEGDPDAGRLGLTIDSPRESLAFEEQSDDPGRWLLETFTESIAGTTSTAAAGNGTDSGTHGLARPSLWVELARSVELVEAVERSVCKRRTIDVHFESPSERGMFKTQMTAVGCSLLVFTLLGVVIYLIAAATIPMPALIKQVLVALIFLPLGIFLAAQLLLFVTRPAGRG